MSPAKKHDNSADGYRGDWLQRGGAVLEGYVDKLALSEALDVVPRTIDRWRNQPDGIPYTTAGSRVLFRVQSVRDWLASREKRPNPRRMTA